MREMKKNTGRKAQYTYFIKGTKFAGLMAAARETGVSKSTILRWCASDKRRDCYRQPVKQPDTVGTSPDLSPLDFLLFVMRDQTQDIKLRLQAARYAIPYTNPKAIAQQPDGKKAERQARADRASTGRFKSSQPPTFKILRGKNQ